MTIPTITPDWLVPRHVQAFTTTRAGGVSVGALSSLNLGIRSGDLPSAVAENRLRLNQMIPRTPHWLKQVHGSTCLQCTGQAPELEPEADAAWTDEINTVLVVLTADCLPVFFSDREGGRVGVAHAGWRGLAAGVLENTSQAMKRSGVPLLAHLGPAIGPQAFEVGPEVREVFLDQDSRLEMAFKPGQGDRWFGDLYAIARHRLLHAGVETVTGGGYCTFRDAGLFYSHRRDPASGRMASVIWRSQPL